MGICCGPFINDPEIDYVSTIKGLIETMQTRTANLQTDHRELIEYLNNREKKPHNLDINDLTDSELRDGVSHLVNAKTIYDNTVQLLLRKADKLELSRTKVHLKSICSHKVFNERSIEYLLADAEEFQKYTDSL